MSKLKSKLRIKFFAVAVLVALVNSFAFSQIFEPVSWKYSSKKIDNENVELIFTATIDKGWHLYSQDIPEDGPVPTFFSFDKNDGFELVGKVTEPKPTEKFDNNFGMVVKYFSDKAVFTQKVKLKSKDFKIAGYLEFMSCDDSRCLPPDQKDFEFNFVDGVVVADVKAKVADTPEVEEKAVVKDAPSKDKESTGGSLWLFFWMAFAAGLAAIVMPCVFPMIPMTVSFFMHSSDNKVKAKSQALFFSLSIIGIYTAIGLIVSVTLGPDFINWLSTNWIPNVFFFIIFMIFAASFFGAFEITLPSALVNKSDAKADKGGYIGAFFMAFTLVLVSFSCTVPIVGMVLVEAARGAVLKPIIGMLGFSLAFALPFGFFAFFPSKLGNLPKSGGWLNTVKVVLGFLELALGLKFLMVADQTYHWGLLDREIYIAIWIAIFSVMGFYLFGKIKFKHDDDVPNVGVTRLILAILTFSFVVYLVPGMFGAPLKALSGYLPPQTSHDFDLSAIIRDNTKNIACGETAKSSLCEEPKYAEFLHLPHGIEGYFDYEQAMACAREQNKPLFIDFTGHGCVNCREMEQNVWSDPRVLKHLMNDFVVAALYVDDKTELPESDWAVSEYDGKTKKAIGSKNADLQIVKFHANSQPNYVLLNHDGELLETPRGHNLDKDAFLKFIESALDNFKTGKTVELEY